jgi:hypothetical protein
LPEHALPFETPQVALDCLPAVLHHGIEVVNEDFRNADAEAWRLQNKEKKERLSAKSF